jgi:hypothetical protein
MDFFNKNSSSDLTNFRSGRTMHPAISKRFSSTLDFANVDQELAAQKKIQPHYSLSRALLSVLDKLDNSEKLGYDECYALLNGQLSHLPVPLQTLVKAECEELGLQMPTHEWQFSTDRDVRQKAQLEAKKLIADKAKSIDWAALVS